jgi:glycine oxidase
MPRNPDVVIIGGGIVAGAIAYRLALEKVSVVVLERGEVGRESSFAAGGMLTPIHLAEYPGPLAGLCAASLKLYPPLVAELRALEVTDPEFRTSGLLLLIRDSAGEEAALMLEEWKRKNGQPVERLSAEETLARQPGLSPAVRGSLFLPDIAQVRNNRLVVALFEAAAKLGAEIRVGAAVTGFLRVPGRVNGVKTERGDVYAGTSILAAGAWSGDLVRPLGLDLRTSPVKGQMLLVGPAPDFCRHMILQDETYFIPRSDGRILIGSTLENAGFDKSVTIDAVRSLATRAAMILPAVDRLPLLTSWAGLRPSTPDRLPYLGRTSFEGLLVATGHYRNGILLAPITAELILDLIAGRSPSLSLEPFDPSRPVASPVPQS